MSDPVKQLNPLHFGVVVDNASIADDITTHWKGVEEYVPSISLSDESAIFIRKVVVSRGTTTWESCQKVSLIRDSVWSVDEDKGGLETKSTDQLGL